MKKEVIFEVFNFLKGRGIAATESEFSEHWLGASESYLRKLRSAQTEPSLGTVAVCASRLMCAAEQLRKLPRYHHLAEQLTHSYWLVESTWVSKSAEITGLDGCRFHPTKPCKYGFV